MLAVKTYSLGPVQTNCYLIHEPGGACLIIDPGEESERLIKEIHRHELTPKAILLTHAHFDHIGAVDQVRDAFSIPVYIHEKEKDWLVNPSLNGSARYPGLPLVQNRKADHFIQYEGVLKIEPFSLEVRHTPGHSPGSISFIFPDEDIAIVGDTLFQGSIGRTDLPFGNTHELLTSIQNKLLTLPEETIIYPGHGSSTTPRAEKNSNPFLNR